MSSLPSGEEWGEGSPSQRDGRGVQAVRWAERSSRSELIRESLRQDGWNVKKINKLNGYGSNGRACPWFCCG